MMKLNEETPAAMEAERCLPASHRSDTRTHSERAGEPKGGAASQAIHARIAEVLRNEATTILPSWIAALRGAAPFYKNISDKELRESLIPIFDAYCRYFSEGDSDGFLALVREGVRARFAQGMPLVEMEKNVGAVRIAVLPVVFPAMAGEPERLAAAMDALFTIEEMSFVTIAEAYQERSTAALLTAQAAVVQAERDKVAFCREMSRLATRDKLILCDHEDIPSRAGAQRVEVATSRDLRDARHAAARYTSGWSEERSYSLQLCIGEAGSNALRHAGGAAIELWSEDGAVCCRLADTGPGIDLCRIPEAIRTGFSTGSTLGMGFTLMLDVADQVYLATDQHGTTLQLVFWSRSAAPR